METLYDKLSTLFVFLVLIWLLIITSGFVNAFPGLFNIVNRGPGRDTTRFNDIRIYGSIRAKEQSNEKRTHFKTRGFTIYTLFTLLVLLATIVAAKLGL